MAVDIVSSQIYVLVTESMAVTAGRGVKRKRYEHSDGRRPGLRANCWSRTVAAHSGANAAGGGRAKAGAAANLRDVRQTQIRVKSRPDC
jgi:hypothetical protein